MRNLVLLLAITGSVAACETHGVVDSRYESSDGSQVTLRQFKNDGRFYYSLSASVPSRGCSPRELKVVAMGNGGRMRVRLERAPTDCDG